ncbi:hybrid sensor histidine kinase/response regulator [Pedosphaera parvula]|uniref:histidine kinase n=1 Tax=Pedosphaera parvula (strain Ellin514) TaxID=320771 RepID=B9XGC5_PEDPL|nr:response regulator [Pedosphaera parvula]EEF60976.1 response regulator receiver sensor signal transduction histidine kinase [Pedosphaera parvula Ellin514]
MKKQIRILLVEDDATDAELIKHALRKDGFIFTFQRVETSEDYMEAIDKEVPDVILSDYALPSFDGYTALSIAQKKCPDVPFIFVTGTMGEEVAIETLKNGATDYVLKLRLARLAPAVTRALRESKERSERKRAVEQLRQSHEQLRALSIYLQEIREEERIRISRAVHDELGQALTGLKIDLSWLAHRLPKEMTPVLNKARDMSAHIDETIQTVRRISTELRPGILDHLGLVAAIEWQANELQSRTGIHCKISSSLDHTVLDEDLNTVFFRIFQETLTNVVRHAHATRVDVNLREENNRLILEVKDNGRGITKEQISNFKSIGLLGMRERASLLGGEVVITGVPKKGTRVIVSIPLPLPATRTNKRHQQQHPHHENSHSRRSRGSATWVETNPRR